MRSLAGAAPPPAESTSPGAAPVASAWADDVAWPVVRVVALLAVAVQCAGIIPGGWAWGVDAYSFLPRAVFWCALCAVLVAAYLGMRVTPRTAETRGRPTAMSARVRTGATGAGALLAAGLVFWVFRIRHVLLGDGIPISNLLPDSHEIHPREPLASALQHLFYQVLSPVFAHPGVPRALVVRDCIGAGSVLAGILFVPVAWALAREIVRSFPAREPENVRWLVLALTLGLLVQGYAQMFFGYVENYAFPVVVAAAYVAASLRFLRGAGTLLVPLGLAALGVALDFTGVVLGPSALVLVVVGLRDESRRRAALRDLVVLLGLAVAAVTSLALGPLHYSVPSRLAEMLASGHAGTDYLLSGAHWRDFLNEHALLGPFGLFLFVPVAVVLLRTRRRPTAGGVFLGVAGATVAVACWTTPDLPLGYARDWDLFTPLGVTLAAAAIALTMSLIGSAPARWRAAALIAVVSLFHTIPWVALNASETRSLARFETLPLGEGRTEATVAYWYAQHGDLAEARRWLDRCLAINPGNNRALDLYGRIALSEHDTRLALKAYLIAVALRPDKPDYRQQLAVALGAAGGPGVGLRQLDTLMVGHQDAAPLWLERAMLLRACGRRADAAEARARAVRIAPELASFADSLPQPTLGAAITRP